MESTREWLVERQFLYSAFACFYRGQIEEGLQLFTNAAVLNGFKLEFQDKTVQKALNSIGHSLKSTPNALLYEEWQELFIGPLTLLAPPWESVYLTKEHLLFGTPEQAVRHFYLANGFRVDMAEPSDHIALELEFMSILCAQQQNSKDIKKQLTAQQEFLAQHLLSWVALWFKRIEAAPACEFWKSLTVLLIHWLKNDLCEVSLVLEQS